MTWSGSSGSGDDSVPALSEDGEAPTTAPEPIRGPRYERRGLLGVGGMGRVYSTRDRRLRRDVAVKVAASPVTAGRMAREARMTAQLEHPAIVAVYDAGEDEAGRPWYAMRLIRGRTLLARLLETTDLEARLGLVPHFHAACQAVAYAHSMGLLHRDLKPENIMVGEFGETQVADWGLARPVAAREADWSHIAGPLPPSGSAGTRRYMSPEQLAGQPATEASDVWSLGVSLLELLSGARCEAADPAQLGAGVPPELRAIVGRCLEPDPARRYPEAESLSQDLERWLSGRRVDAHEYTPRELLLRLVAAWRAPLVVGGAALFVLAVVLAVAGQRTARERAVAQQNLGLVLTQQARAALAADRIPEAEVLAAHALALGPSPEARGVLAGTAGPRPRLVERRPMPAACQTTVAMSPDGERMLCTADGHVELWSIDGQQLWRQPGVVEELLWISGQPAINQKQHIKLLASDNGVVLRDIAADTHFRVFGIGGAVVLAWAEGFSVHEPDGEHFYSTCSSRRETVVAWEEGLLVGCTDGWLRSFALDGSLRWEREIGTPIQWGHAAVGEGRLLVGSLFGALSILEPPDPRPPLTGFDGSVLELEPVAGSPYVLVRGERGGPRIWDTALGAWVGSLPGGARQLAAGPQPGQVWLLGDELVLWALPAGLRPRAVSLQSGVAQVEASADGERLALALGSGAVELRERSTGALIDRWRWQAGVAKCAGFLADGALLSYGMEEDGPRRLVVDEPPARIAGANNAFRRCGGLSDGSGWGVAWSRSSCRFDLETGESIAEYTESFFDASASPSRDALAMVSASGIIRVVGLGIDRRAQHLDAVAVDVGDGGTPLVVAERQRLCVEERCVEIDDRVVDVAVSATGLAAAGTLGGDIWLYDSDDMRLVALLRGHSDRVSSIDFGPEGRWLLSGSWDHTVRAWDLAALQREPEALLAEVEAAWQLDLQAVLSGR